jgi:hypothetical protein
MSTEKELIIIRLKKYFREKQKNNNKLIPKSILLYAKKEFEKELAKQKLLQKENSLKITSHIAVIPIIALSPLLLPGLLVGGLLSGTIGIGGIIVSECVSKLTGSLNESIINKKTMIKEYKKFKNAHFSNMTEFSDFFPRRFNDEYFDSISGKLKLSDIGLKSDRSAKIINFEVYAIFKKFEIVFFKQITIDGSIVSLIDD